METFARMGHFSDPVEGVLSTRVHRAQSFATADTNTRTAPLPAPTSIFPNDIPASSYPQHVRKRTATTY
jgi:hypothetical protein